MGFRNNNTNYKWLNLTFYIVTALLVAGQLFWLNKIYQYQQKEFNVTVIKSIKGIYEDLYFLAPHDHLQNLIEQPDEESFLFKIDSVPEAPVLTGEITKNLEDFGVFTTCIAGVFDKKKDVYVQTHILKSVQAEPITKNESILPDYEKNYSYILLSFPHRNKFIFTEMRWWIVSSTLLILVLIALGISNFKLYRQKFLNEIQNDFIRNVTHEFQTPLTTLLVGLNILSKPSITEQPEKLEKYTGLMQAQTLYLKQHIENLSRVMQAESRGTAVQREYVDPNDLVEEALCQLYQMVEETGATVRFERAKTEATIFAEKGSIFVAISNLITNALKYSANPEIVIKNTVTENNYSISVKDNGIGISKKMQKQLFKKFYRVPTGDVQNVRGLGLGLYFVKKAALNHHGQITVVSEEGEGSEFILTIPKNKNHE